MTHDDNDMLDITLHHIIHIGLISKSLQQQQNLIVNLIVSVSADDDFSCSDFNSVLCFFLLIRH